MSSAPADYRAWIVLAYAVGVSLMLAKRFVGAIGLWWLVWRSREADATCRATLTAVAGREQVRVRLLISDRAAQPFTFTWLRPTIVLPSTLADGHDMQSLRWCLAHEWAHVARADARCWLAASLARVLFWYQPLCWLAARELRLCQDYLADAYAAGAAGSNEDYAEFLTRFVASLAGRPIAGSLSIKSKRSDLYRRVVMLVQNPRPLETRCPRHWNVAIAFAAALVAVLAAAVGNVTSADPPADKQPAQADPDQASPGGKANANTAPPEAKRSGENTATISGLVDVDPALRIEPWDSITIKGTGDSRKDAAYTIGEQGRFSIDDRTSVFILGLSVPDAQAILQKHFAAAAKDPSQVKIVLSRRRSPHSRPADPTTGDRIEGLDVLRIEATGTFVGQPIAGQYLVEPDGDVVLPGYGRHAVKGLTIGQAEQRLLEELKKTLGDPKVTVDPAGRPTHWRAGALPSTSGKTRRGTQLSISVIGTLLDHPIHGTYVLEKDGRVNLGPAYGRVNVLDLTPAEAEKVIDKHLRTMLRAPQVRVTIGGWELRNDVTVSGGMIAGDSDVTRQVQRLQREVQELRAIVKVLQTK